MTEISAEVREKYKALKAEADALYARLCPMSDEIMKPWHEIEFQIDELLDGAEVITCEGCGSPIFEGDKTASSTDGTLCLECAPTYQDILDHPEMFASADEEPMTLEQAKELCNAHIEAGGKLSDTTAT